MNAESSWRHIYRARQPLRSPEDRNVVYLGYRLEDLLATVLVPTNSAEATEGVTADCRRRLGTMMDGDWEL